MKKILNSLPVRLLIGMAAGIMAGQAANEQLYRRWLVITGDGALAKHYAKKENKGE